MRFSFSFIHLVFNSFRPQAAQGPTLTAHLLPSVSQALGQIQLVIKVPAERKDLRGVDKEKGIEYLMSLWLSIPVPSVQRPKGMEKDK